MERARHRRAGLRHPALDVRGELLHHPADRAGQRYPRHHGGRAGPGRRDLIGPGRARMKCTAAAAAMLASSLLPAVLHAQPTYPARPILVILPLGAGSGSDIAIRTLGEKLSVALKQQIVVEDQPGAAGLIGAERAAKAAPDGYTLTALNNMIMATLPQIHERAGYDSFKSFTPITIVAGIPTGLIVHPS